MTKISPPEHSLSVIIPAYNEDAIIETTIKRVSEKLETLNAQYEIIVVNDGSCDETKNIAKRISSNLSSVTLVTYDENKGRGHAIKKGLERVSTKYVVITEADLSWGVDIIENLYRSLVETEADMVVASPHARGGKYEMVPKERVLLSAAANRFLSLLLGKGTMFTGMTRGYKTDSIKQLNLESNGKELHLEIIMKAMEAGMLIKEIPATLSWRGMQERRGNTSMKKLIASSFAHLSLLAKSLPLAARAGKSS